MPDPAYDDACLKRMVTMAAGPHEAFEILKKVSQNSNIKLRDIAERLVQKTKTL